MVKSTYGKTMPSKIYLNTYYCNLSRKKYQVFRQIFSVLKNYRNNFGLKKGLTKKTPT